MSPGSFGYLPANRVSQDRPRTTERPVKTGRWSENMIWNKRSVNTAVAACVLAALLGAGQRASAKVIYTPFAVSGNGSIPIDLNHDGTTDFTVHEILKDFSCGLRGGLTMTVAIGSNNVVVSSSNRAAVLPSGILINSSSTFHNLTTLITTSTCPSGSRQVAGYLGLRFPINGQPHYGWALLEVNISRYAINTKLLGFAYETIAGQGIRTGQISGTASATETPSESSATVSSRTNEISANTDRGMLRGLNNGARARTVAFPVYLLHDEIEIFESGKTGRRDLGVRSSYPTPFKNYFVSRSA